MMGWKGGAVMPVLLVFAPLITAVALLLGLQAPVEDSPGTKVDVRPLSPQDEQPKQIQEPRHEWEVYVQWGISLAGGGLAGAIVNAYLSMRRSKGERRSLIVAFCYEFVESYGRCVGYLEQAVKSSISYSMLYSLTDASMLARYAGVCADPRVIRAIVELKSSFFQIGRHVKHASEAARQLAHVCDDKEKERLMLVARSAQGMALAFFRDYSGRLRENIELLLNAASHDVSHTVLENLQKKYVECKEKEDRLRSQ